MAHPCDYMADKRAVFQPTAFNAGTSLITESKIVTVYIDYKSPYAYLANDLVYEPQHDFRLRRRLTPLYPRRIKLPRFGGRESQHSSSQVTLLGKGASARHS